MTDILIQHGRVIDPANLAHGIYDVWINDGNIEGLQDATFSITCH